MKRLLGLLLLFWFTSPAFAQHRVSTKEVKSKITRVTVFLKGAQITRMGELQLYKGNYIVKLVGLSPYIDQKSIQVKGEGNFTITGVNANLNYLNAMKLSHTKDSLNEAIKGLENKIATKQNRLDVLAKKRQILDANIKLGGQNNGVSITQLKQALALYESQLTSIKSEELKVNESIKGLRKNQQKLQQQLNSIGSSKSDPTTEISIKVEATASTKASFTVDYIVSQAGWYPKYDVRAKGVDSPLSLSYKAEVYQHTGVDWDKVQLTFSNGDPNKSGVAPALKTWYLDYARNTIRRTYSGNISDIHGIVRSSNTGDPLPGVNVVVKGTSIGTSTDLQGKYSLTLPNNASQLVFSYIGFKTKVLPITSPTVNARLEDDVQQLQEVVITTTTSRRRSRSVSERAQVQEAPAAKTVSTVMQENQTTVEFKVDRPYTVKTDAEKLSVDLKQFEMKADYEYYAVPKLDKDAFLIAHVPDWGQYNLLEGEANLYFEDGYVGRTIMDAKSLADTLDISLGRDKSIVLSREKVKDYSERKVLGSNKVDTRGYKIVARNNKEQPIQIKLLDQIPVSRNEAITVTPTKLSGGDLDKTTGFVTWVLDLKPKEQKDLNLQYEVKYPKREKVILE